jgi:hypothetical protein
MQHKQDPLQGLPVWETPPTRIAKPPLPLGQQRLEQLPQLVRDDPRRDSHLHPSQLDNRCGCLRHARAGPCEPGVIRGRSLE